jgi:hypothetical protein
MFTYNTAKYIETENKIVNIDISPNILEKYGKPDNKSRKAGIVSSLTNIKIKKK